jgi:aminopeptidase N
MGSLAACEPEPLPPDTSLGVSQALAESRAETLSELAYQVRLDVPSERTRPLTGSTTIRFRREGARGQDLVLDFKDPEARVEAVRVDGESVDWEPVEDHIVLNGRLVPDGERVVEVDYTAGDEALNRSEDFMYTLFVPDRAHFSLPVFDQPDLKARFTLELTVPDAWVAVSNGPTREAGVASAGEVAAGRRTFRFAETEPISTYLFAFAAGEFQVEEAERDGRTFRMYHRETDTARVVANRDTIFDLVASSLAFMEDYTGIPYPFAKYDLVLLPPFQYGGMEHPGAVFYRQSSLFLESSATQGEVLGRASLIAHETAHQWFGDLVTMVWFDDVWMKEVFANFIAAKIVNPSFPQVNHELRFLLSHYPAAYGVDRTAGTNPIRQPLANLNEAGSLYGPIIYQKAPVIMRQLERIVGEESFREGMRDYLERYAYGNASWPDLIALLDERTLEDLVAWSSVWVEEPGRPTVLVGLVLNDERIEELVIEQEDPAGEGRRWPQQLTLVAAMGDSLVEEEVLLAGARHRLDAWQGRPAPTWVLPNGSGLEYGRFVLDSRSLRNLPDAVPGLASPLLRGSAWLTLRDALLDRQIGPEVVLDLALRSLAEEREEQLVRMLLGQITDIYWRLLPDTERTSRAPEVEAALWSGLAAAPSSSLKASYLAAYRSVSLTPGAVERLEGLWSGRETIPGLTLAESDRTALATALALREVPDASEILDAQAAAIDNPDRRARFEFVRPSLSNDANEREAFFQSLADPANREREPWVLDGLANLNHPLRRAHARRFVLPALTLLEEVQETGDIFFPGRWLGAVLNGHNDPEVAATVASFLEAHPEYPERLEAKILQSADGVVRAAAIVYGTSGS